MRISELTIPQHLAESSLTRISKALEERACGVITAYRGDRKRSVNQRNNQLLAAKLMAKGFGITAVKGSYVENFGSQSAREVSEHSFFVTNLNVEGDDGRALEIALMALGEEFDQDSIISIPFGKKATLIGTSERSNSYPPKGQHEPVGKFKGGKAAQFMSRINNRPFVFEDGGYEYPNTVNGIRGMHLLAAKKPDLG